MDRDLIVLQNEALSLAVAPLGAEMQYLRPLVGMICYGMAMRPFGQGAHRSCSRSWAVR